MIIENRPEARDSAHNNGTDAVAAARSESYNPEDRIEILSAWSAMSATNTSVAWLPDVAPGQVSESDNQSTAQSNGERAGNDKPLQSASDGSLKPGRNRLPGDPGQRHLESRAIGFDIRADYNAQFDWRMEQSEITATARVVAQTLRNTNGMLQPEQEALLRAALQPRLEGATSSGSPEQQLMIRLQGEVNRQLHGTGYFMIFNPGISGAPMIRFDRHFQALSEGTRYPAFQEFLTIRTSRR